MKPHSVLFATLVLSFVSFSACRESHSPTDPGASQPPDSSTYSLFGHVFSTDDQKPVGGARIEAPGYPSTLSDSEGAYRLSGLRPGFHRMIVSKEGFLNTVVSVEIGPYGTGQFDFVLARNPGGLVPAYELSGMTWVKGAVGRSAYVGAKVEVLDGPQAGLNVESDEMGMYSIFALVPGTIHVRASRNGASETQAVTLDGPASRVTLDFEF